MDKSGKLAVLALALTTLTTSAFADTRHQNGTSRNQRQQPQQQQQQQRSYRDNERVNQQGRVTSLSQERGGYRVQLDRDRYSYWVPESYVRNRRDFRVGVSIGIGGVFRGGSVYADVVSWPGDSGYGYNDDYVRGIIDRVDYRRQTVWLRDDSSGRLVAVEISRGGRSSRLGIDDLRRGAYVELSGQWARGGVFIAQRVESIRNGRY